MLGKIKTLLFGGLLIAITGCSVHATEPGEVGVKVNLLTGLDPDIYAPGGTYFFPPLITDFYTFSTQTQTLTMLADPTAGDREGKDDLEFKTRDGNDVGVMHACGHDMHVTCLLAAAAELAADPSWSGTLQVVVQPAEELGAGARAMIEDGFFDRFGRPGVVLGQHVSPLPAGAIGLHPGPAFAAYDALKVTLHG